MPAVSLITVCYNAERTVARAIQSVNRQTLRDFEHIVVDGASTDATLRIAEDSSEQPLRVISEPDEGIYDAMNKGVALARGEILYFLNADDELYEPSVLSNVVNLFRRFPGCDLLWGNVVYVDTNGVESRRRFGHVHPGNLVFLDLNHQGTFARRRLFEQIGGFDTRFRLNADYDWLLRVFRSSAGLRYEDVDIARFHVGGRHARDVRALREERLAVRLQYISPIAYRLGALRYNLQHKWRRVAGALSLRRA